MGECNHVWKVPLYGSSDMLRCEKCGKDGCGYEIANDLEQQLKDSEGRCKSRDKVIYSLEQQLAEKDKLLKHCKALLDHCTYHDGRYEQCANSEYQNNCCATSDRIEVTLKERDSGD